MAPSTANPPSLPPTVEEAYRRKCIQLRARTKEIEDENDAYRLRLIRLKRQIQKVRLERAILLEQIAKRTSTNVEDSDGSPSPPPTPEDKPLRNKRGHRKLSIPGDVATSAIFISQSLRGHSPVSEFSHGDQVSTSGRGANGIIVPKPPKRPSNAFEIYCKDMRPLLQSKNKESIAAGEFRLEEELARGWKDLPEKEKEDFQTRYEQELAKWKEERSAYRTSTKGSRGGRISDFDLSARARGGRRSAGGARTSVTAQDDDAEELDNDVEMGDVEAAEAEEPEQGEANESDPETEVEDGEDAEN